MAFDAHFTIANIPFGVASRNGEGSRPQVATRLKDFVYFLPELVSNGVLQLPQEVIAKLHEPFLNSFAALGRSAHRQVRKELQELLTSSLSQQAVQLCRAPVEDVTMHLPVQCGDFSDFSLSRNHVLNAGLAVFGAESLPPGFLHFPVGYAGRSSSVVVSGTSVRRPLGQFRSSEGVIFGPSKAMDFELEVACVVGKPSSMGLPVRIDDAMEHVFGFVLLNDWSARDIQGLEMNPLGPFNGKSAATSISPWIVTVDALEPFRTVVQQRDIPEAPYLQATDKQSHFAVNLQVDLIEAKATSTICKSRLEWMYWTFADMISHQTINGCAIRSGDLLATGTVSGREEGTLGCLLEVTRGGKQHVKLSSGSIRTYLEDGDTVQLSGWAGELGSDSCVGFGDCIGQIVESLKWDKFSASSNGHIG